LLLGVNEASERFRTRAQQCRELATTARDAKARQTLSAMAEELDAEAELIEAEESGSGGQPAEPS
jgi:hypothetical protein